MKDPFAVERAVAQGKSQDSDLAELLGELIFKPIAEKTKEKAIEKGEYLTPEDIPKIKDSILNELPPPETIDYDAINLVIKAKVEELVKLIPKPDQGKKGNKGDKGDTPIIDITQIKLDVLKSIPKQTQVKVDYFLIEEKIKEYVDKIKLPEQRVVGYSSLRQLTDVVLDGIPQDSKGNYILTPQGVTADTFETVSKNLDANGATLNYTGENLTSIEYANGIIKTLAYTGDNLTSITLSGDLPSGIETVKTLSYTGDNLTGIAYS